MGQAFSKLFTGSNSLNLPMRSVYYHANFIEKSQAQRIKPVVEVRVES